MDAAAALDALRGELDRDALAMPLLPGVAAEVIASSVDEHSDAARLAELIRQDQSLASHVLRIVNSPAFRGASEIVALQQAIARLGMPRVREIALSASLKGALLADGPYQSLADAAWRRSLAAALWSREVARSARRNVEIAYLCGLLHDLGTPLLLHALGRIAPGLAEADVASITGSLGPCVGARLARSWALPEAVVATVEHLDDPDRAGGHASSVLVASAGVALARLAAEGEIDPQAAFDLPWLVRLNLYPEDVDALVQQQQAIRDVLDAMVV